MSYYSFYGGKPGITYDIRAHFPSIQAMCNAFSQGNNYTDVLYGEYVIIDTVNKTDTTNGILYRRSGNFNEPITSPIDRYHPGAGAEYVGQIAGPAGTPTPIVGQDWDTFITHPGASANIIEMSDTPGYDPSGATPEQQFHDTGRFGYVNIVDGNNITTCYLSFDIPYPVFDFQYDDSEIYRDVYSDSQAYNVNDRVVYNGLLYKCLQQIPQGGETWTPAHWQQVLDEPYYYNGDYYNIIREDSDSVGHHYYWKEKVTLPKGVHGTDVEGISVNNDNVNNQYFQVTKRTYQSDGSSSTSTEAIPNGNFRVIRNTAGVVSQTTYKRQYIDNLRVNQDYDAGALAVTDTLNNNYTLICIQGGESGNAIPDMSNYIAGYEFTFGTTIWRVISNFSQVPDHLKISYTSGADDSIDINLLTGLSIDRDGRVYALYSNVVSRDLIGEIKNIKSINLDSTTKKMYVLYENYLRDANGDIIKNSTGAIKSDADGHIIEYLDAKFINSITLDEDNFIKINYTDNTSQVVQTEDTPSHPFKLRTPHSIYIENEGDITREKRFKINYNVGATNSDGTPSVNGVGDTEDISANNLNTIVKTVLFGDCLCILWSSPAYRNALPQASSIQLDINGTTEGSVLFNWENLGSILDGQHIFREFSDLASLRAQYPYGFGKDTEGQIIPTETAFMGWIAIVDQAGQGGVAEKHKYFFDYNTASWTFLCKVGEGGGGSIDNADMIVLIESSLDNDYVDGEPAGVDNLVVNGVWLTQSVAPENKIQDIAANYSENGFWNEFYDIPVVLP